jgi:hypothetical protein
MSPKPSHGLAAMGGFWTAAGFVPFDIWVGSARIEPPQLLGTCWMLMAIVFLWAPWRFLVAGSTIGTFFGQGSGNRGGGDSLGSLAARACTWVISCAVSGMHLSMLALALGHEGG